ncbi:hypothetical protein K7432_005634 [Basidiobolus ranarum]|uniref:Peptidase S8/S53 domain-containing protein n=1 Tax=Basidiobolus ranarum TaxID=34480 RepID=A0ABR2WWA5_9FUNG
MGGKIFTKGSFPKFIKKNKSILLKAFIVEFNASSSESVPEQEHHQFRTTLNDMGIAFNERISFTDFMNTMSIHVDPKDTDVDKVHKPLKNTGAGSRVGVIDTGIDYTYPALGGYFKRKHCRVQYGYDFVGNGYDEDPQNLAPSADSKDCDGDGTHVAGIIGANDINFVGVAPEVIFGAYQLAMTSIVGEEKTVYISKDKDHPLIYLFYNHLTVFMKGTLLKPGKEIDSFVETHNIPRPIGFDFSFVRFAGTMVKYVRGVKKEVSVSNGSGYRFKLELLRSLSNPKFKKDYDVWTSEKLQINRK